MESALSLEEMHDWTLLKVVFDWESAQVTISFRGPGANLKVLVAQGVKDLKIPRMNEWGPSSSVNETSEAQFADSQARHLKIEMQTGDVIEIIAHQFTLSYVAESNSR
jgi:hypothetical protein